MQPRPAASCGQARMVNGVGCNNELARRPTCGTSQKSAISTTRMCDTDLHSLTLQHRDRDRCKMRVRLQNEGGPAIWRATVACVTVAWQQRGLGDTNLFRPMFAWRAARARAMPHDADVAAP
ncbi:uncharacterized protein PSANT_06259 [Moesziomyces antarcticus]|uniref:Uncharacterized protein n=1 Tax=Pseudozyma antarctica TaxID=84753 RepID=A0A5C3FVW6_PSEA2|nr:uncharacterized protein PSANT_06259 [Moesziomyces antarcticus]